MASAQSGGKILSIIRKIAIELRRSNPKIKPVTKNLAVQHLLHECRKHQVTDKRVCKGENELEFTAKTYLCYLESSRKYQEMHSHYRGRGERSVEETASLVGFSVPQKVSDPDKNKP